VSWKSLIAGGILILLCAPASGVVRVTVKDGRKLVFNDGVGEATHEALKWRDNWLVERVAIPSLYDQLIETTARRHSVDPRLVKSVMLVESGFNPAAISPKGARGLMQLMPATANAYGVRDIHDPAENIAGGTRYLSYLLGLFGGNLEKSLAAYNAGETAVTRYGGIPPYNETRLYVHKTLTAYNGKAPLGGGFGISPSQTWAARPGKPVRLLRDSQNRILLTTSPRARSAPAPPSRPRLGLRRG
jgi:hypothetical protein